MPAWGAGVVVLALIAGCARPPLVERAIAARGGPLTSLVRRVEADVHVGFAGRWTARMAYRAPDRWALTIDTTAESDSYTWDGDAAYTVLGSRTVAVDRAPTAPLRSQARFWSVANLDALQRPGVVVTPLPKGDLPPGVAEGALVTLPGDGGRYRLGVDAAGLVVWVAGPVVLPPFGTADLTVRFSDFRRAGGFRLPWAASYLLAGSPILDERTLSACPDDPATTDAAFAAPALLPACEPPDEG